MSATGLPHRRGERQQCDLAGVFHRERDVTLMLNAVAGHPTGPDLAALADVGAQQRGVFVVDHLALVGAERALARLDRLLGRRAPLVRFSHLGTSFVPWSGVCQKGGSSSAPPKEPEAGALPHGSSAGPVAAAATAACPAPKPPPPPRLTLWILAVAYRSDGPISSTSTSKTVRFSPSRVSNERCRSRPLTMTRAPRVRLSATFSAASRQMLHRRNNASPSRHSPLCRS